MVVDVLSSRAAIRTAIRDWRCSGCGRPPHNRDDVLRWNQNYINGRPMSQVCPDCQTPVQTAEADHNLAEGVTSPGVEMCEARLFTAETFRRVCQRAIDTDNPAPTDEYLDEHGGSDHLVLIGATSDTEAIGMAFPFDAPVLDFVKDRDGEEWPLISASGFLEGPHFIIAVSLTEIIDASKSFVPEGWLQAEVSSSVKAYLESLGGK
jgi:hypothetical protein